MAQPAVTTPAPPLAKVDSNPAPPPPPRPPPQPLTTPIKQEEETHHLAIIATHSLPSERPLQSLPPEAAPSSSPIPSFINSINELRQLSAALSDFHSCYDDLLAHISSVGSTIESRLNSQTSKITFPTHEIRPVVPVNEPTSTPPSIPFEEKEKEKEKENEKEIVKPMESELEGLCLMMASRGLRKYMVTHLGEANRLREEVPKALKLAQNPAKLVLDSVGRFFLQGKKAYTKDSPMITAREASVLTLECFLLAQCDNGNGRMDKELRETSEKAAKGWRKRLISEGGLAKASEIDARGLLLFVGCFGIPPIFRIENFRDLIRAGNVKEISSVLTRSSVLMTKIPEIIELMVKMKMAVDAVDIAYTFGLEDKVSPEPILTSFLRDAKELWKRTKRSFQGSLTALNEANKKYLTALQSVIKCLESHKIDSLKVLQGWQINNKITSLEKDIADFDKKIKEQTANKRKADETVSAISISQEGKRSRYVEQGLPKQLPAYYDSQRRLLDSAHGHTIRSLPSPPIVHGTGVGGRISTGATYAGIYIEAPGDTAGQTGNYSGQPYGLHGDAAYSERLAAEQTGNYGGHPYVLHDDAAYGERLAVGQKGNYGGQPYGLHGDAGYSERLAGAHSHGGQPQGYGLASLYLPSASLEEFPGLPSSSNVGLASRSGGGASDLYQFADAVVENEAYHSSGSGSRVAVATVASAVPAHHSSYLYYKK